MSYQVLEIELRTKIKASSMSDEARKIAERLFADELKDNNYENDILESIEKIKYNGFCKIT